MSHELQSRRVGISEFGSSPYKDPAHNSTMGEDFDNYTCNDLPGNVNDQGCPSQVIPEANLDLQMCEAGPSRVNNAPPELSLPPFVPDGDADEYGLSNLHPSLCIAHRVEQVGLQ